MVVAARRCVFVCGLWLAACGETAPVTLVDGGTTDASSTPDAGAVDCSGRPGEGPGTRGEIAGALDPARQRILVFGGNTAAPVMCMPMVEYTDEVWAFHLDCGSWERVRPGGEAGPGVRARVATALDTQRQRVLVFGGRTRMGFGSYENHADVWAYDLATDAWAAVPTTGTGPSARSSAVTAYDAARDRLLVFGGNTSTSGLTLTGTGDLFALDLATGAWSEIVAEGPSPRLYHAGAVVGDELVVFGGTPNFDGPFLNDTWALDMTTDQWRSVNDGLSAGAPEPRFGHALVADPAHGRVIVLAGHDGTAMGNRNDAWALTLATSTWSALHDGDTLNGVPAGRCDFPADFTLPEEGSPERRYGFATADDGARAFVIGGKTDCGNVNDVWSLDFEGGAWSMLRPTTGGEACNRSGRLGCSSLCF